MEFGLLELALKVAPTLFKAFSATSSIGDVIEKVGTIAEKVFGSRDPNVIQAQLSTEQIKADLWKSELSALSASDVAQNTVNAQEAQSPSMFVAGWRPACGWICTIALGYIFVLQPIFAWISIAFHVSPPPTLDSNTLMTLLFGMLGLGTLRTTEKIKDVARDNLTPIVSTKPVLRRTT